MKSKFEIRKNNEIYAKTSAVRITIVEKIEPILIFSKYILIVRVC